MFNPLAVHWQSCCANDGANGKHQGVLFDFSASTKRIHEQKWSRLHWALQRIKKALNNDLLFPTLSFIVYTSNIFKPLLSQSKQPLIYILYIWMKKLVGDLLFKFYSIKFLSNIGGSDRLLKISEYIKFNVYAKKKYNTQREVGSKTKELLASIDTLEKKKFKERPV